MSNPVQQEPGTQVTGPTTSVESEQPRQGPAERLPDLTRLVRDFNAESRAHEDLWSRTRRMTDEVGQSEDAARQADTNWANADLNHRAIQAENPDRSRARPRQLLVAAGALSLDGVACYFAAEALGGSPAETLVWAGLFLALLGAGELTLDLYRESHRLAWRWTVAVLATFIAMLSVLRFWFLATVGTEGLVTAGVGAVLFTLATAGFVVIGYRALRVAETNAAWRARRQVRSLKGTAASAHHRLERLIAQRDALARAYVGLIRSRLVRSCPADQLPALERAVWAHLCDRKQS